MERVREESREREGGEEVMNAGKKKGGGGSMWV